MPAAALLRIPLGEFGLQFAFLCATTCNPPRRAKKHTTDLLSQSTNRLGHPKPIRLPPNAL